MITGNKRGRFVPFWILFGILIVLFIGSLITPFRYVLDDVFRNIEENAINNGTPELSCTNANASGLMRGTCFVLGGAMVTFVLYLLYMSITAMVNGSKKNTAVFGPRLTARRIALGA